MRVDVDLMIWFPFWGKGGMHKPKDNVQIEGQPWGNVQTEGQP